MGKLKFLTDDIERNIEKNQFEYHFRIFLWSRQFSLFLVTKKIDKFSFCCFSAERIPYLPPKSL